MRCLSIADAFTTKGYHVRFITADHLAEDIIKDRGYDSYVLNSNYSDMESELPKLNDVLVRGNYNEISCIIVDSYYVTFDYFTGLRKIVLGYSDNYKIVYLDDLGNFPYPVDVLINYNLYGPDVDYQALFKDSIPKLILGSKYIPLRIMFRGLPDKVQNKAVNEVLISTGGSDPYHLTVEIIRRIEDGFEDEYKIIPRYHFLIGSMNQDLGMISKLAENHANIILHFRESDIRSLICAMDLCVSAAGSTLYEICACGVPVISFVIADNQLLGAEAFEKSGLSYNIGDVRSMKNPAEEILTAVDLLSNDHERRIDMGRRMQKIVDGYGADRVVEAIVSDE